MFNPIIYLTNVVYYYIQVFIIYFFKPPPPPAGGFESKGRIAVIGAGLTGVSAAAHAVAHGFEVVIFESDSKTGGIWARVNSTSGLQLNSISYRFHPGVHWSRGFPLRDEIVGEIRRLWKEYDLESCTRFNTPVTAVRRLEDFHNRPQWSINDGNEGIFDAIIAAVGTCGEPLWVPFDGMPKDVQSRQHDLTPDSSDEEDASDMFRKPILHSSQLDSLGKNALKGKVVVVVGSGASGVESVETALAKGAKKCMILARGDRWIIPRNLCIDTLIAMQPFGREMPFSLLWEMFLQKYHYHGVEDLVPGRRGLFEGTPIVNDDILSHIRAGKCDYIRCDTKRFTKSGVLASVRQDRFSKPGDAGEEKLFDADVIVLATGFKKPTVDYLPKELFPTKYDRPNLYLQVFSTEDWSVGLINCAYMDAIGSVGHVHIGIYTRILLTFLMDPQTRPPKDDMKLWVDVIRWIKGHLRWSRMTSEGNNTEFGFFTYMELTIWFMIFHLFNLKRLQWMLFILNGWGTYASKAA